MQHGTVFSTSYDAKTVRGKNINYKCLKTLRKISGPENDKY
jgi:hypothetical protein